MKIDSNHAAIPCIVLALACMQGCALKTGGDYTGGDGESRPDLPDGDDAANDSDEQDGDAGPEAGCSGDEECSDHNPCNGIETCSTESVCVEGEWEEDGTECGEGEPGMICLHGACEASECGDGFVDVAAGEECEPPDSDFCGSECTTICTTSEECDDGHDCTVDSCDVDGTQTCEHLLLSESTECRPASGDCDAAEFCDGINVDCAADAFAVPTTLCRPAAGSCDAPEYCTGLSPDCPADGLLSEGTACDDENPCTYPDACDFEGTCMGTPVDFLHDAAAVTAGTYYNCALMKSGGVKCWGQNHVGQLGNAIIINSPVPVDVSGLTSAAVAVDAGDYHTCAVLDTGGVMCWGWNANGQLGDGTTSDRWSAVNVSGLSAGVVAIGCGGKHSCAVLESGALKCWGYNVFGQLGTGGTGGSSVPVDVSGLSSGVASVCMDENHTCALVDGGGVKCWGWNHVGQLGDTTTSDKHTPVDVAGLGSAAAAVSCGMHHNCALLDTGAIQCWGWNSQGQLGDGTTTNRTVAVSVTGLGSEAAQVSCSHYQHTCAVLTGGAAKCWGWNNLGQLGDGTSGSRRTPVDVVSLPAAASIATGYNHTCALLDTTGIACWGQNHVGQLGAGNTSDSHVPVNVVCP
ncbi:MAG: hypothetical protein ABIJ56_01235 [Pseudomonadota bacterium]